MSLWSLQASVVWSLQASVVALLLATLAACGGDSARTPGTPEAAPAGPAATASAPAAGAEPSSPALSTPPADPVEADEPLPAVASPYDALPESARNLLDTPFTGNLDALVKRRVIRAGVTYNRTHYFVDRGQQRGVAYESLMNFEQALNDRLKSGNLKVYVAIVPLPRDMLLPALVDGKVDMVVAQLTVTPEREKLVAFTNPTRTKVDEVVVTGPGGAAIASPDDLSGKQVFLRASSSYHASVLALNERLRAAGKAPVEIKLAPESLEDDDILEMVNAGLVPATVVDDYLAQFWKQVFPQITVHPGAALRSGGVLAVAVRKNNPKLKDAGNLWLKKFGESTAFANVLQKRYLQNTQFVQNAATAEERKKLEAMLQFFRKYGEQYAVDPLMMVAQGYQESRLDQNAKSHVGAIGVMQLMPATGKEQNVGDITKIEPNIQAGIKYMRFMVDQYYKDEPMTDQNKLLMTFASYNAGPARVRQLRREAENHGLDPNVWFGNVERVASEKIGRETVQYVSNIYKYYIAYTLIEEQRKAREALKQGS